MRKMFLIVLVLFCVHAAGFAQVLRYVAPTGVGNEDGSTPENAADFLEDAFWREVQGLLQDRPVTVMFSPGDYERAYTTKTFLLRDKGHATNRLTLEGTPETFFTAPAGYPSKPLMVSIINSQNITIRNFHFRGEGSVRYVLRMTSRSKGETKNILIEDCSWIDMGGVIAGATGTLNSNTSHITIRNCTFKKIGTKTGLMAYNAHGVHHLSFIDCYFEDCPSDYLRFRDKADYVLVSGCTFIRSNLPRRLRSFISMPVFNKGRVEAFATNYAFVNNEFIEDGRTIRNIIAFHQYGHNRPGFNYLLTPEEGDVLSTGTVEERKRLLQENFGINMDSVRIHGNKFPPHIENTVVMGSKPSFGAESKGWQGFVNIFEIVTNRSEPFDWEPRFTN